MTGAASLGRLNGIIRVLEAGKPALACFSKIDRQSAIEMADAPYDGLVYEMEHNPDDVAALDNALKYMLSRKAMVESGSVAPGVTPLARIPANGCEMNQFQARQALNRGAHGVITPHVGAKNVERLIGEGFRFLLSAPSRSYGVVGQGRELAGY